MKNTILATFFVSLLAFGTTAVAEISELPCYTLRKRTERVERRLARTARGRRAKKLSHFKNQLQRRKRALIRCVSKREETLDSKLTAMLTKLGAESGLNAFVLSNADFSTLPQDPKNPITHEKVELGKLFFHETALGLSPKHNESLETYSCASCHHAKAGFQAGTHQGIGEGGLGFGTHGESRAVSPSYAPADIDVQPLRSPTILNAAFQEAQLWNGQFGALGVNKGTEASWASNTPIENNFLGFSGVETQAIAGLGVHRLEPNNNFAINTLYRDLFDKAFPEKAGQSIEIREIALAIAAYERTVVADKAPFQRWLRGDVTAMSVEEKEGALLFFGKAKCVSCHTGPALNSMEFHALGMKDLDQNDFSITGEVADKVRRGRGGFTGNPKEDYAFKVPQLYNLKSATHFGHGASFTRIRQVVAYKNKAKKENPLVPRRRLSAEFKPLNLTSPEIKMITIFLREALFDPELERYVPEELPSGFCFPNNDSQSQADMGCG